MKTTRNALFAVLLLGVCAGAASAQVSVGAGVRVGPQGHASVDLGFFYDSLAPYGNWIERPSYGWVWTPREVSSTWRPYQAGHWVWSDEGWTWLSDEPYGWATYHYGRWYQDPEIGWAWVPGNDWAPAWVSWQEGNDYVGWAPLPPGANVNASNQAGPGYDNGPGPGYDDNPGYDDEPGYDDNPGYDDDPAYEDDQGYEDGPAYDDNDRYDDRPVYGGGYGYSSYAYGIAPSAYLFVPTRVFLSVDLFDFYVPWVRVSSFFRLTRNCTSYGFYGGRYFNRGISFAHVRRYYRNVPRYRLAGLDGFRGRGYHVEGNRVSFFRPRVSRSWRGTPLDRAGARRSVVSARQFRNDHPDRQRSYAQNNQRGNWQGNPSRQAQGDRSSRNAPRWQDQASRQRSFENGRAQADRRQQYNAQRQQQYNTRQWQQDQANRQRSYDRQRSQPQEGWQRRQYNVQPQPRQPYQSRQPQTRQQYQPRQQQQYQQRQQQPQRQQFQPQRQAPPRQQYRSNSGRGQSNHGSSHRRHGG